MINMLDMKLPVLEKDERWPDHILKLTEEYTELVQAFLEGNPESSEHVIEEIFDLIQVCVGILDKLENDKPGQIKKGCLRHIEKLHSRGWKFKKWLEVNED